MYFKRPATICSLCLMQVSFCLAVKVDFIGTEKKVIELSGDKTTGLNSIFVSFDSSEIEKIEINGISGTKFEVSKYSTLGGGYAEEIKFSNEGGNIIIESPESNIGYLVKSEVESYNFWLTNYSTSPLELSDVELDPEQECETTKLSVTGKGDAIYYYTIDGRQKVLSRDITLTYTTLEWDETEERFVDVKKEKILEFISSPVVLIPPFYCNTSVEITGDRFLKEWGIQQKVESSLLRPSAVSVMSKATQSSDTDEEAGSNIINTDNDGLGGSAPANIFFEGFITDGVLHTEWQMASDADFEYILYRFNEQDVTYTFTEEGTYYMRFIGSNADGTCEAIGDTYQISIGSSELRIPNAFSPNNDGVNDVWKVGYRSLLSFKCWIFDSKGTEIFRFEDPSNGWDGKYHGKFVKPGVYYYVIEATGSDGKKYKKSGDINILNYKKYGESTGSGEY